MSILEDGRHASNDACLTGGEKETSTSVKKPAIPAESKYVEREDDDGYDPWSDRREEAPLFEPDPWR